MLNKTEVEWHDLELDPEDLPSADEGVLVTIETNDGERKIWGDFKGWGIRRVWADVFYDEETECWCTFTENEYGQYEKTMLWYKVVGWAYYPAPMPDVNWRT